MRSSSTRATPIGTARCTTLTDAAGGGADVVVPLRLERRVELDLVDVAGRIVGGGEHSRRLEIRWSRRRRRRDSRAGLTTPRRPLVAYS
jgi:hypothetical protein